MSLYFMSWIPQFRLFINYIIFKKNKKKERKRMKKLLQSALQPFLYSATILYNNNVPKIIIYIYIYIYIYISNNRWWERPAITGQKAMYEA